MKKITRQTGIFFRNDISLCPSASDVGALSSLRRAVERQDYAKTGGGGRHDMSVSLCL